MLELWGMQSTSLLPSLPGSHWPGVVAPDKEDSLSGATTPGQCEPGSDGNKEVLCIPQSSSITGTSPSDWAKIFQSITNNLHTTILFRVIYDLLKTLLTFLILIICGQLLGFKYPYIILSFILSFLHTIDSSFFFLFLSFFLSFFQIYEWFIFFSVSWGCKIRWLHLCREVIPPPTPQWDPLLTMDGNS